MVGPNEAEALAAQLDRDIASDASVCAGTSSNVRHRFTIGAPPTKDQMSPTGVAKAAARPLALPMKASTFARLRTIPASARSRARSASP